MSVLTILSTNISMSDFFYSLLSSSAPKILHHSGPNFDIKTFLFSQLNTCMTKVLYNVADLEINRDNSCFEQKCLVVFDGFYTLFHVL